MKALPDRLLLAIAAVLLVALLGLGAHAWRSTAQASSQAEQAQRAQAVLTALASLMSAATDAETGQRGYALSGDASFLEPYQRAQAAVQAQQAALRDLLSAQPEQYSRLVALGPLLTRRFDALAAALDSRRRSATSVADDKRLHDRVRAAVDEMQQAARAELAQAQQAANAANGRAQQAVLGLSVLALVLLVVAAWRIRRDMVAARTSRAQAGSAADERAHATAALQQVLDASPDAIFVLDDDGRFSHANPGCEALWGWPARDLLGRACAERVLPEDLRRTEQGLRNATAAGPGAAAQVFRGRCKRKDGSVILTEWHAKAAPVDGGLICVVRDITTLEVLRADSTRQAAALKSGGEELARAQAQARVAERATTTMLGTLNEELRTPLNAVVGYTAMLRQGLAGPLNAQQNKELGVVHDAAQQLTRRVLDLLDMAHLEAGQLDLRVEPFDLWELLQRVAQRARHAAADKGLQLNLQIEEGLGYARGDARRVEQVLDRLLGNAVQHTPRGSIGLRATPLPDGRLRVTVNDTGLGLQPQALAGLFKPYGQPGSTPGLGLKIAHRLAALMGGELSVRSEPRQGSEFTLVLQADAMGAA